jgi:hypothetical protein
MICSVARVVVPSTTWTPRCGSGPSERGVDFAAPPARMHFGWWALFRDQDGTRYALTA